MAAVIAIVAGIAAVYLGIWVLWLCDRNMQRTFFGRD